MGPHTGLATFPFRTTRNHRKPPHAPQKRPWNIVNLILLSAAACALHWKRALLVIVRIATALNALLSAYMSPSLLSSNSDHYLPTARVSQCHTSLVLYFRPLCSSQKYLGQIPASRSTATITVIQINRGRYRTAICYFWYKCLD